MRKYLRGYLAFLLLGIAVVGCGLALAPDAIPPEVDAGISLDGSIPPLPIPVPDPDAGPDAQIERRDASVNQDGGEDEEPNDAGFDDGGVDPCEGYYLGDAGTFVNASVPPPRVAYGGHCYWITPTPVRYDNAQDECTSVGGYRVVVTSAEENNAITKLRGDAGPSPWMGLEYSPDYKVWYWVSSYRTPYDATRLVGNQAERSGGCTRLNANGDWEQTFCANGNPTRKVVCERRARK